MCNAAVHVLSFLFPGLLSRLDVFRAGVAIFCLAWGGAVGAQVTNPDIPAEKPLQQRMQEQSDSLRRRIIINDSLPHPVLLTEFIVPMSRDSLDAPVEYGSVDSNYFDNTTRQVHLFGKAYVRYKDLSLTAAYIVVDLDSSIATAEWRPDSTGQPAGLPEFKMGAESFTARKMRYNFRLRRGIIYEALTREGDLHILGERTKFVAADPAQGQSNDLLYGQGALITTCTHPSPHFAIRATKVKTIPNKLAVVGASNLELFGVPTPLWLPFGFYPVSETRRAGVILPRDYENSPQLGFGIRDIGYYFPVADWADVRLLGDIYFNGTWGLGANVNYVQRYKFRGNVNLRFAHRVTEPINDYRKQVERSFSLRINHTQDPKSNPNQTLGGSINIQSNNFEALNYNDAESTLTNSYSSNFNYTRNFPGKPYAFSAAMNHSQNTRSHLVTINAPELNFRLNRIYPFRRKQRVGPEQWFEKIAFQYAGSGRAQLMATDTTLLDKATWQSAQYGLQHKMNANVNFSALKYFNFTPSVDYSETWYFKTQDRMFVFDPSNPEYVRQDTIWYPDSSGFILQPDTISFGKVESRLANGFVPFRSVTAGINMSTQLFGTIEFGKGWLRGFRHVLKPSFGFSFSPKSPAGYVQQVPFSVAYPDSAQRYSIFDNLLYSNRPTDITQANLNYSFINLFEAKYFSRKDTTEKRLKLFDNIGVSGSYNMAADSFHFSPVNISGNTRLFKGISTVTVGATYSFYDEDANGRAINRFYWDTDGAPLRFDNFRLRVSSRIRVSEIIAFLEKDKSGSGRRPAGQAPSQPKQLPDRRDPFTGLIGDFGLSHEFGLQVNGRPGRDTTVVTTHTMNMVGSMRLTANWAIHFGNIGYDFRSRQLTYPDIGITRDLHCWTMGFNWQPVRGTYAFSIGVKPGTFDFLRFPYQRNNYDTSGGF